MTANGKCKLTLPSAIEISCEPCPPQLGAKMTSVDQASGSENSDMEDLLLTPKKKERQKEEEGIRELSMPGSGLSHRFRTSPQVATNELPRGRRCTSEDNRIAVMVQGPSRPWEYQPFVEDNTVDTVLAEVDEPGGGVKYRIEYEDGRREDVSIRIHLLCFGYLWHLFLFYPMSNFDAIRAAMEVFEDVVRAVDPPPFKSISFLPKQSRRMGP